MIIIRLRCIYESDISVLSIYFVLNSQLMTVMLV